jgi:hypothetical protein
MTTQLAHPTTTATTATAPARRSGHRPVATSRRRITMFAASALLVGASGLGVWSAATNDGPRPTAPAPDLPDYSSTDLASEGIEMLVAHAIANGTDPMTLFPSVDVVPDFPVP